MTRWEHGYAAVTRKLPISAQLLICAVPFNAARNWRRDASFTGLSKPRGA